MDVPGGWVSKGYVFHGLKKNTNDYQTENIVVTPEL